MDGATEPMESDSDMNVKSLDSDNDVTSGLHARSKRLEHSTPDTLGQRDVTQSDLGADSVTITISREDAAWWSAIDAGLAGVYERNIATACRAALEDER